MKIFRYILILLFSFSCSKDDSSSLPEYVPTPLALEIPILFEQKILPPIIPFSNPQTVEGVTLGKKLFFDPILSGDNSQSCSSCHNPVNSFTDNSQFSAGVDGVLGNRNAMPLINLAFNYDDFFA